jgi:hypothetical protein
MLKTQHYQCTYLFCTSALRYSDFCDKLHNYFSLLIRKHPIFAIFAVNPQTPDFRDFRGYNPQTPDFRSLVWGNSQSPDRILAKIVFFVAKTDFRKKNCANIFARSAAVSPWGNGFISLLLAKSDSCGIFRCILRKSCFSATPLHIPKSNFIELTPQVLGELLCLVWLG